MRKIGKESERADRQTETESGRNQRKMKHSC